MGYFRRFLNNPYLLKATPRLLVRRAAATLNAHWYFGSGALKPRMRMCTSSINSYNFCSCDGSMGPTIFRSSSSSLSSQSGNSSIGVLYRYGLTFFIIAFNSSSLSSSESFSSGLSIPTVNAVYSSCWRAYCCAGSTYSVELSYRLVLKKSCNCIIYLYTWAN